jgi:hypothetical protein
MPLVAPAGGRDATKVIIGPGWLYLGAPVPAPGAPPVITAPVPPNTPPTITGATLVGYTKDGAKFTSGFTLTPIEADESKAPLWQQINVETVSIDGTLMQLYDPTVINNYLPNAVNVAGPTTPPGTLFTFGGLVTVPTTSQPSVILIGQPRAPNDSKYVSMMIYSGMNVDAFVFNLTRKAATETTFKFDAQPISSRPLGDQLGQLFYLT